MRPVVTQFLLAATAMAALAGCHRKEQPQPQPQQAGPEIPTETAGRVDRSHKGEAAPAIPFLGPNGGPATLATFRGKPLLVNLWATWCAPCVAELPALGQLAAGNAGRLRFVAVSQDIGGRHEVDPFLVAHPAIRIEPYTDKENVLMTALKADNLPLTIFYDAHGRERWRVMGRMDWAGTEAQALIAEGLAAK